MLRHFSNYVVGRGQRVEGAHQVLHVAVAPDPPEARFRLHQRARHPALNHLTATPPPGVGRKLAARRRGQPGRVIALADKAQRRLCRRFRRLAEYKPGPVVTVAVARELVGFVWAALHPETV